MGNRVGTTDRLLKTSEVQLMLGGVSDTHVARLRKSGAIRYVVIGQGPQYPKIRYEESSVREFLARNTRGRRTPR